MTIEKAAAAGTLESSDVYVRVEPAEELTVEIDSIVARQYGEQIRACALDTLRELDVTAGRVSLTDRGALDCVIRARVETAVRRAEGGSGK